MKKIFIIILALILVGIVIVAVKKDHVATNTSTPQTQSIVGCYATTGSPDMYSLTITGQTGDNVSGTLTLNNAEKDSSSGTIAGTYRDGILLADYTFQSEGTTSVMQVAFKRVGNDFVRGYGDVDATGTHFTNVGAITYDSSSSLSLFKAGMCEATPAAPASTVITYPLGGEHFVAGKQYTLTWTGGPAETQIFLIDTSTLSVGMSVSIVDRVYHLSNTGSYQYTIPKTLKPGTYELEIGDSTSKPFTVATS